MRCSLQSCLSQLAAMDLKKRKKKREAGGKKVNLQMKCTYLGTDSCNLEQIQDILGHTLQQNLGNLDHRNVKKKKERERKRSLKINKGFLFLNTMQNDMEDG